MLNRNHLPFGLNLQIVNYVSLNLQYLKEHIIVEIVDLVFVETVQETLAICLKYFEKSKNRKMKIK